MIFRDTAVILDLTRLRILPHGLTMSALCGPIRQDGTSSTFHVSSERATSPNIARPALDASRTQSPIN
jgi:hypothetical protein